MHQSQQQPGPFWRPKTLQELVDEQKISPAQQADEVFGQDAGLWESDEELERFPAAIRDRRHDTVSA